MICETNVTKTDAPFVLEGRRGCIGWIGADGTDGFRGIDCG